MCSRFIEVNTNGLFFAVASDNVCKDNYSIEVSGDEIDVYVKNGTKDYCNLIFVPINGRRFSVNLSNRITVEVTKKTVVTVEFLDINMISNQIFPLTLESTCECVKVNIENYWPTRV